MNLPFYVTILSACSIFWLLRPSFFNYLVYGSADPFFQDFEKNEKNEKKNQFFFLQIFSCRSQARIKDEDLRLRPALNPLANKLWSPVHNEREELEPTDPVQGYDTISK